MKILSTKYYALCISDVSQHLSLKIDIPIKFKNLVLSIFIVFKHHIFRINAQRFIEKRKWQNPGNILTNYYKSHH